MTIRAGHRRSVLTTPLKNPRRRYSWVAPVVAVILVGCALSVAGFLLVDASEETAANILIERRAAVQTKALQDEINDDIAALAHVRGIYDASRPIGADWFGALLREFAPTAHDLSAVAWLPRVTAAQRPAFEGAARRDGAPAFSLFEIGADGRPTPVAARDEYFPVYYIEPRTNNEQAVGFDVASDPVALGALTKARDSGEITVSAPVENSVLREAVAGGSVIAFVPVYRDGNVAPAVDGQRENLNGFVIGVFPVAAVVRSALEETTLPGGLDRYVYDAATPGRILYFYPSRTRSATIAPLVGDRVRAGRYVETGLRLGDREWQLVFRPVEGAFPQRRWPPFSVLGLGLALTALLAYYLYVTGTQREWVMRQVAERTRELSAANASLAQEIEERERAERALRHHEAELRESQAMLRAVIDAVPAVINVKDIEGRYVLVNAYQADYYGMPIEAIIGKTVFDVAAEDAGRESRALDRKVIESGQGLGLYDAQYRERDGRTSTWLATKVPLRDAAGAVKYVVGVGFDISERKRLEVDLMQAQKMTAIGQLSSGIAHDFNNLLTAVLGNLELLGERLESDPESKKLIEIGLRATRRGANLTQRLLAFSRRETLAPVVTDVNALVADMTELLHRSIGEMVRIETVLAQDLWHALIDRNHLENAILNLAINARDAMPQGGPLVIETGNATLDEAYAHKHAEVTAGEYVMLAISDTGTGMSPEVARRAFEPFFTTKDVGRGSGLGLSMVYGFIKQTGGHVRIYSEPGHGTTVRLYLPRALSGQPSERPAPMAVAGPSGGDETVLVVEDDSDVRAYVTNALSAHGYRVLEAEQGPATLALLDAHSDIDLLLTDVVLPGGMNGRQVAEAVLHRCPRAAVLYTSGYAENVIVHHGQLDPGVELIAKPYRKEELLRRIRRLLDDRRT